METTEYIWMDGEFVKWDEAKVHVLTHALHYGSGAFEGIRAYATAKGPAIFRLKEHTERLLYSANAIGIELPFSAEQINSATVELVKINKVKHCYIRPLAYLGYGKMGLNPQGAPSKLMIACWPWGAYLPHDMVDIITSNFIRIHPKTTVADAKICGHYVNSIMAVRELIGTHYHEALFKDYEGNIAEGPGENIFVIKNGKVTTPPLGAILAGITRQTVITLLNELGVELVEKNITEEDIYQADEAFFTGTAAEVTPIKSLNDKIIKDGKIGDITAKVRELYLDIVQGRSEKHSQYLTFVN